MKNAFVLIFSSSYGIALKNLFRIFDWEFIFQFDIFSYCDEITAPFLSSYVRQHFALIYSAGQFLAAKFVSRLGGGGGGGGGGR
jgi:hypothetical protein